MKMNRPEESDKSLRRTTGPNSRAIDDNIENDIIITYM